MSKRMKRSLPYLQILAEAKPKLRKILIKNVPESVINAICEFCLMQISDILQRDDVTDNEKRKLFNTYFERYLELRQQKETAVMKEER